MDCDVMLKKSEKIRNYGLRLNAELESLLRKIVNPWRHFEEFLVDYRPALGDVEHYWHFDTFVGHLKKRKQNIIAPYYSGIYFDGMFNAFHRDVINDLLPYDERFDSRSWWCSQQIMQCRTFVRYHGHVVIPVSLTADNFEHSSYVQGLLSQREVCEKEMNSAPLHIRNSSSVQEILEVKFVNQIPPLTYIAPKRTKIEKYKYFGNNFPNQSTDSIIS